MEQTNLHNISVNLLDLIHGLLESIFGPGLSTIAYGRLTRGDLLALAILAAIVWMLGLMVSSIAKSYRRRAQKADKVQGWPTQIIRLIAKPLRALVWLVGIYFVVTPALVKSQSAEDAPAALQFAERVLDVGIFAIIVWLFYRATELIRIRLEMRAKKSTNKFDDLIIPPLIQTLRVVLPLIAVILGLPILELPVTYDDIVGKITALTFIGVVAWILFQSVRVGENLLLSAHDIKAENNLEARKIHTLTYVVIHIWDQRRLIVPLSHFIEKPFQNWTRTSSEIMGSVFLWTDYTVPLDELRQETKRIVETHPKWDRKFWNLQVTDTTDRSVQLRVLATASDSGKAWDMRCDIREQLISFLQKNYPAALPKVRAEMHPAQSPA